MKISDSLQKIARLPNDQLNPVTAHEAQAFFGRTRLVVPDEVYKYVKKICDYRKKSATTNFGIY
jgi:hypothetical protein